MVQCSLCGDLARHRAADNDPPGDGGHPRELVTITAAMRAGARYAPRPARFPAIRVSGAL